MKFVTKLFVFAVGLTAIMGVWRVGKFFSNDHDEAHVEVAERPEAPEPPEAPEAPEAPEPMEALAPLAVETPVVADVPGPASDVQVRTIVMTPLKKGEVRILTRNGAGFLSLQNDDLIAGFSDSLVQSAKMEMQREMNSEGDAGKLGELIKSAVQSGVGKVLNHRITMPVSEIRSIDYKGERIVIAYKREHKKALLDFEGLKMENETPFLASFKENEARRLVEAVRVRIR